MRDSDAWQRLQAAGFAAGECYRVMLALAGARVPTAGRLRALRAVELAGELLAEGRSSAEVVEVLRARFGCSRRTAYNRIAAARALQETAPTCTTGRDTAGN